MKRSLFTLLAVLTFTSAAPMSTAQLIGLTHLWTVPGVMNTASGLRTVITCTNTTPSSKLIGVDIYDSNGLYVDGGTVPIVPAAGTAIIATDSVTNLSIDLDLTIGNLPKGSARVFSTDKGILCNAAIFDGTTGLPQVPLTIARKKTQKGD